MYNNVPFESISFCSIWFLLLEDLLYEKERVVKIIYYIKKNSVYSSVVLTVN